jgi:hypothetical protein
MKNKFYSVLGIAIALLTTSCATIAGNNSRAINVSSEPVGAAIYVDNQQYGVTPAVVTLPTYIYGGKAVTLKKQGYHDQTMMVNTAFQPIALLDILLLPTFLVDAVTGYIVKVDPANTNLCYHLQKVENDAAK